MVSCLAVDGGCVVNTAVSHKIAEVIKAGWSMKNQFKVLILVCIFGLVGCTDAPEMEVTPVVTQTPAAIITQTSTPLPVPTATPSPTIALTQEAATETPNPTPELTLDDFTIASQWGRGNVYDMTYSNDGSSLFIISASGTYIHDVTDPNNIQHKFDSDLDVMLSPDGETAVIGQEVRRLDNDELLFTIDVNALNTRFFLDGEILAVKGWVDGEGPYIELWQVADGTLMHRFDQAETVSFTPDGSRVAVKAFFGTVEVYEWPGVVRLERIEPRLNEGSEIPRAIPKNEIYSPDGRFVARAWEGFETWHTEEGIVEIRDAKTNDILVTIPHIEPWGYLERSRYSCDEGPVMVEGPGRATPTQIEFSPDGHYLAITYRDDSSSYDRRFGLINIHRVIDGQLLNSIPDGKLARFSPDSQSVTTSTGSGNVAIWQLPDFNPLHEITGYTGPVRQIDVSENGQFVAVNYDTYATVQNFTDGEIIAQFPMGKIALAPDGETAVVGYNNGVIEYRQIEDNALINSFSAHNDKIRDLIFIAPNEVASVANDCTMSAWNVHDSRKLFDFENSLMVSQFDENNHIRMVVGPLVQLPSGKIIVGDSGVLINFWSVKSGELIEAIRPEPRYESVEAPNGERIVLRGEDIYPISLWLPQNDEVSTDFAGASSLAFNSNGTVLAAGYDELAIDATFNGYVWLWDSAQNIELIRLPSSDRRKATAVTFSPDDRYLLVGSLGGLITVWELPDL